MQTLRTPTAVFTLSPTREDSFEIVGDVPEPIEAYELQGAELEIAYAEFEALAA